MAVNTKGDFTCSYEDIPATDARHLGKKRVLSVECSVRRVGFVFRGAAPNPLVGSIREYLTGAPELQKIGYSNGHLVGLKLGGPDDTYNIAPMFGRFNEVDYRKLERDIYDDTTIKAMRVTVVYDDVAHALPVAFHVEVRRATAQDPDARVYTLYQRMTMKIPSARPYPFDTGVRDRVAAVLPHPKPAAEPYQFLQALGVGGTAAETSDFTEIQRQYILTANALYNLAINGEAMLTSDDPEDPIRTLNIFGGDDRPQIDHFIARSLSGANSSRNAMVLSKRLNGIKSAKIDAETMAIIMAARDVRPTRGGGVAPSYAEKKKADRKKTSGPYGR